MKSIIISIIALFFVIGCSTFKTPTYENIPTDKSIIKQISQDKGLTVDQAMASIALINYGSIRAGLYSKDSAIKVLEQLRSVVEAQGSYRYVRSWLIGTLTDYPELIEISEMFPSSPRIMYEADQEILLDFIDRHVNSLKQM